MEWAWGSIFREKRVSSFFSQKSCHLPLTIGHLYFKDPVCHAMFNQRISSIEENSDAALVLACLGGSREAYGRIIERYQRLLCSLAYASMGNISESEDIAQEAFIEGWHKLSTLREPSKLRPWLCGILRFKISHRIRKVSREPTLSADIAETLGETESPDEPVEEQTMRKEEQALLWTALKQLPENYREPLVLYYREHQSIEHVAGELDLSEDVVKQRLSRGRKMLQERMMTFVEDALVRSTPGKVFTMGVLAALPSLAPTVKAAGVGATAMKAGSVTKALGLAAILASVSGLIGSFFMVRANLDQARTPMERKLVIKTTFAFIGGSIAFILILVALMFLAIRLPAHAALLAVLSQVLILAFLIVWPIATYKLLRRTSLLRARERIRVPEAFSHPEDQVGSKGREYRSRWKLLGIPLVHMQFSVKEQGDRPAVGWIAFGERAYGILFAFGGFAVGGISVGLVTCGVITCSVVGVGLIGMGTVGVGWLGFGAISIGYKAFASVSALGWQSAWCPGFAIAKEGAIGAIAYAKHVNTEAAAQIASLQQVEQYHVYVLCALSILVIAPVVFYAQSIRKRMRRSR